MKYIRKADYKVECIVSDEDFDFFGVGSGDVLDRTDAGVEFTRKVKRLSGQMTGVMWTNIAYTLKISVLRDGSISMEFSECIDDYIQNLRNTSVLASDETKSMLEDFIKALENSDDKEARKMIEDFEKNVRSKL